MARARLARVCFQLDYHLSSQFAGLVVAKEQGIYAQSGLDVELRAPPPAGEEPDRVCALQRQAGSEALVLGSVEQNTLCAAQLFGRARIRAVAAMLHATPLAIATAPGRGVASLRDLAGKRVAAASDTEQIVRSALADADPALPAAVEVVPVPRERKLGLFLDGDVDAFQVYTTTEAIQLERLIGAAPVLIPFGMGHGYAQVIFGTDSALADRRHRRVARAFLDATFDGWCRAIADPGVAATAVSRARAAAGVCHATTGEGEHSDTAEFQRKSLEAMVPYLTPKPCYKVGQIDVARFMQAADQIAADLKAETWFSGRAAATAADPAADPAATPPSDPEGLLLPSALLDTSLWPQPPLLRTVHSGDGALLAIDGHSVAVRRCAEVACRAERFERRYGRKPQLAVVEIESALKSSLQSPERAATSPNANHMPSWVDKEAAGAALHCAVDRVMLPPDVSNEEVERVIRRFNRQDTVDGILMELPDKMRWGDQLDADRLLACVDPGKCIDGMSPHAIASLVSRATPGGGGDRGLLRAAPLVRPTTPASVMDLLERAGVTVTGKHAVVIGNSRLCGAPIALMLQSEGAAVSTVTSTTPPPLLRQLCAAADVVVSAVGSPGLIDRGVVKAGAVLINVGSVFDPEAGGLIGDLDTMTMDSDGLLITPVPGGVGPNPVAVLFENLVARAEHRATAADRHRTTAGSGWAEQLRPLSPAAAAEFAHAHGWELVDAGTPTVALRKQIHMGSFRAAAVAVQAVDSLAAPMNHHPLVSLGPGSGDDVDRSCFDDGCVVTFTLRTLATGGVSTADLELAQAIDRELSEP